MARGARVIACAVVRYVDGRQNPPACGCCPLELFDMYNRSCIVVFRRSTNPYCLLQGKHVPWEDAQAKTGDAAKAAHDAEVYACKAHKHLSSVGESQQQAETARARLAEVHTFLVTYCRIIVSLEYALLCNHTVCLQYGWCKPSCCLFVLMRR